MNDLRVFFVRMYGEDGKIKSASLFTDESLFLFLQQFNDEVFDDVPSDGPGALPDRGKFCVGDAIVGNRIGYPRFEWEPDDCFPLKKAGFLFPYESGVVRPN